MTTGIDDGFTIENLPYGVFSPGGGAPRVGVAIGDSILDCAAVERAGLLDGDAAVPPGTFDRPALNPFLALGPATWRAVRARIRDLLDDKAGSAVREALVPRRDARLHLPIQVGDYVDFYSSLSHATNLGRMFRPDGDPLLPNWRHLPVGYHGRSGTIVVSGTPVTRPAGQRMPPGAGEPIYGPSVRLDFELELGFVCGPGNALGEPIPIERADEHLFGVVLVNDWSARDIQAWEYQPLGPFLGKSFATSISPWVVPLEALEPFRVPLPPQTPEPLPYLRRSDDWLLDVDLTVDLEPDGGGEPTTIARSSTRNLYWSASQQLAHTTVNGATIAPGDLLVSGTISGDEPDSYGSMIELSWNGARPVRLRDGSERSFLEDGDTVIMRGRAGGSGGALLSLGEVAGRIAPARDV